MDGRSVVASETSEGAIVDAIDIVREGSILSLLSLLLLLVLAPGLMREFGENDPLAERSSGDKSCELPEPDPRRRGGMTLPLIVCEKSLSLEYVVMDIVRSSGLSGTTLP